MQMARRVALDGLHLDDADARIVISAVEPGEARENISAAETAGGFGQRIESRHRSTMDIVVRFKIMQNGRSAAGMQVRSEVLEKANAWARNGGLLTTNFKPGKGIRVVLAQPAAEGSLWAFDKEFQLTFRAYGIPYWEDTSKTAAEVDSEGSNILFRGSAEAQVDAEMENTGSGTIDEAMISIGGVVMSFDDLGLEAGEALVIDHTDDGLLRIRINNEGTYRSAMAKRTPESADDFLIAPGLRNCYYSADGDASLALTWRNRYL